MTVLFITHGIGLAGANRSMLQLILELRANYNVHPIVLLPPCEEILPNTLQFKLRGYNIPFIEEDIPFFKTPDHGRRAMWWHVKYLLKHALFYRKLQNLKIDIIHSNSSVIDLGAYISHQLKVKHVWHFREFGDKDYNLTPILGKRYERFIYRQADAYIAISKVIADHFKDYVDSNKLHTIYNGISFNEKYPLSSHRNETLAFLCAGIIDPPKNQKEIALAVNELVNTRGVRNFVVRIIGLRGEPYTSEIEKYVNEHSLTQYIYVLEEADGIDEIASQSDVGIMCSNCEAFGRVTVEYMLYNLAVIANDEGANTEIIIDGDSGMIYPHNDYVALADRMQELINNKQTLCKLAEAGRKRAKKMFLSKYNTEAIYKLYDTLISDRA